MFEYESVADDEVVDRLREAERQIAVLHAEQLRLIAELYRRAPDWITAPADTPGLVDAAEIAAAEIGVALRISRRSAMDRLGLAVQVLRGLPDTAAAMRSGTLSLAKVRIIADATADLSEEHARQVEARVLPRAGRQTPAGLGASVARAVLAADPDAARRRRAEAVRERTVRFSPGTDGMASLWARLPAEDALCCYRELCELADTAAPPPGTAAAADSDPALATGSAVADDRTADARRADTLVDLIMGAAAASWHPDVAAAGAHAPGAPPAALRRSAPPRASNDRGQVRLDVTVAWTTLAGLDDEPGYLGGYGPIDAATARELAADATWRRLLTDPATGTVLDVGSTRYAPPAAMAALVRARDRTCRWYGCRQPVSRCDLDHTVPYPHGPTATSNLAGLCRGHHRLKTHTRWRVEQDHDGVLTWTSPTGEHVSTEPWPRDLHPPDPPDAEAA